MGRSKPTALVNNGRSKPTGLVNNGRSKPTASVKNGHSDIETGSGTDFDCPTCNESLSDCKCIDGI